MAIRLVDFRAQFQEPFFNMSDSISYYSIRCLFSHPTRRRNSKQDLYEERITLWRAATEKEAYIKAEKEAAIYAKEENCIFIGAIDGFHLFQDNVSEGSEVWSLMRDSSFDQHEYINTLMSLSTERSHDI